MLGLTEPSLAAEAAALLDAAAPLAGDADERERDHLAAVQRLAAGDWLGAGACWERILARHPRDALALQWTQLFDFHRGDSLQLRTHVEAVLPAWSDDDPLYPYVLALHAFGLEESARSVEAEATGRRALAGAARVPWAIHAVAHVMEMQGRHEEGRRWMNQWRRHWGARAGDGSGDDANGFASHLGWHEAPVRARRPRHRHGAACLRRLPRREPDRDHAAARRRRGAALAPAPARRRRRRSLATARRRLAARRRRRRALGIQRRARDDGPDRRRRADAGARLGRTVHRRHRAQRGLEPRCLARARRAAGARPARVRRRPRRRGRRRDRAAARAPRPHRRQPRAARRRRADASRRRRARRRPRRGALRYATRTRAKAGTPLIEWWARALA